MTTFGAQCRQFRLQFEARSTEEFANVAAAVQDSIVNGSAVTGAPGQPVDTGALKASFILALEAPMLATITTNLAYAPSIEDGVSYRWGGKPMTRRSPVGGWHSVAMTAANFDRLVAVVVAEGRHA